MKKYIIQEEIEIDQEFIDRTIKIYEDMPDTMKLCIGNFSGNKDDIIREIKNMTEVGKQIILIDYNFKQSEFYKEI